MRQVGYNNAAFTIVYEYPLNWDIQNITGVNVTVDETDGTELVSSAAATIYTASTLNAASAVGDAHIQLAVGAAAPAPGRQYKIAASSAGADEIVTCRYYDSTNRYLYATQDYRQAHSTGTAIKGCYCSYDLDTSTVATYTKGKQLVITWFPTGSDDMASKELAEVASFVFGAADFEQRFASLYPRENSIAEKRNGGLNSILFETIESLKISLSARGLNLDRVIDQSLLMPSITSLSRWIILLDGGDKWVVEREVAMAEYTRNFEILCSLPIWQDKDQDEVMDDGEVDAHGPLTYVWSRNI